MGKLETLKLPGDVQWRVVGGGRLTFLLPILFAGVGRAGRGVDVVGIRPRPFGVYHEGCLAKKMAKTVVPPFTNVEGTTHFPCEGGHNLFLEAVPFLFYLEVWDVVPGGGLANCSTSIALFCS